MNNDKIVGKISFIVGVLIIVAFFVFWGLTMLKILDRVSYFIAGSEFKEQEVMQVKTCSFGRGAYSKYDGKCYKAKDPESVETVCHEWDKKMQETKEKIERSVVYLDQVMSDEQKLALGLWKDFFAMDDKNYYEKHIIPVWIEKEDIKEEGVEYAVFHISYSVKMGEWFYHEVGNFNGRTDSNMVVVRKDQYSQFIEALKNKKFTVNQLSQVTEAVRFELKRIFFWRFSDVTDEAHLLATLQGFDGLVAAQKYPFVGDNITCEQVVSTIRKCDPGVEFGGLKYGLLSYGEEQVMQVIPNNHYSLTGNAWFGGSSAFSTGRMKDCHEAIFDLSNRQLGCSEAECDPYKVYGPMNL